MSTEPLLPYCSHCFNSITDFASLQSVQCKHLFCPACLKKLMLCPLDRQEFGVVEKDETLERELGQWETRRTDSRKDALFDLINVTGVQCRLEKEGKQHDLSKCRYDHRSVQNNYDPTPSDWLCPKCGIQVVISSPICPVCSTDRPPLSSVPPSKARSCLPAFLISFVVLLLTAFFLL